jgi:hypothetical protein
VDVVVPFLRDPKNQPGGEFADVRELRLQNLTTMLSPPRRMNRGPASEGWPIPESR